MNLNNGGLNEKFFPKDFQPGAYDILIGRGKKCYNHIGNINFRNLVSNNLDEYSSAKTKQEKSNILADLVKLIRKISPNGGFLKQDSATGLWYEVGDFLAREKTSQAFRDALHEDYRSSNSFKKKQRRKQNKRKPDNCNVAEPVKPLDLTVSLNIAATKVMEQIVDDDIFADFTSSTFDMDGTESEESVVSSHQSTEVTENMDELEDFSLSDESDLIGMEMDDLSDSSFDNNFDDLFMEDCSLFEVDTGFDSFSHSIPFSLKEQALCVGDFEDVLSFDKKRNAHTDYKSMFVSNGFDGFNALPSRNISVAKTA